MSIERLAVTLLADSRSWDDADPGGPNSAAPQDPFPGHHHPRQWLDKEPAAGRRARLHRHSPSSALQVPLGGARRSGGLCAKVWHHELCLVSTVGALNRLQIKQGWLALVDLYLVWGWADLPLANCNLEAHCLVEQLTDDFLGEQQEAPIHCSGVPAEHSRALHYSADLAWHDEPTSGGKAPPRTVNLAFWLGALVPTLYTLLILIVSLVTIQDVQVAMRAMGYQTEQIYLGSALRLVHAGFFIGPFTIVAVLWVVFGLKLRAGHHWARVTLTAFAVTWLLFGGFSLLWEAPNFTGASEAFTRPAISSVLTLLANILAVATTITFITLVFAGPANRFFLTPTSPRTKRW